MSLLLNALKKAEEGEKKPAGADESAGAQQAQSAAPAVAQSAALKPAAAGGGAAGAAAPKPAAAAPAAKPAAVDFDAIEEEESKPGAKPAVGAQAAAGAADGEKRARVDAARVFGASAGGGAESATGDVASGGAAKKIIFSLIGVAAFGGGVYFVLVSGVIPGFDMRALSTLIGLQEPQVAAAPQQAPANVELEISDDVVLLPVPSVDIQSKVDFAALRLPENNRARIGEAEYMQRIAYLTGFDFDKERTRVQDEQRDLIVELDISLVEDEEEEAAAEEELLQSLEGDNALAGIDGSVGLDDIVVADRPIYNADESREDKFKLDSATPSDRELESAVAVVSAASAPAAPSTSAGDDASQEEVQVAQKTEVKVRQSQEGVARQRMIKQAQALYNQGSYLEAEAVFRNVLAASPTSRDALRGVAQIALVTGRYQVAVAAYLDLLGFYPNDPVAIAELTNLRGDGGDFYEMEKALKGALGKAPSADGRLYFSLGNLYAQHGRLRDAQQAYFEAFSRETTNSDYAYNLAVLLDHLNKPGLAVRYYSEALQLSQGVPVGFSRAEVRARIKDLQ